MNIKESTLNRAAYMRDKGYVVTVDLICNFVLITNSWSEEPRNNIDLHGVEADIFIQESQLLFQELKTLSRGEIYLALAKDYLICF